MSTPTFPDKLPLTGHVLKSYAVLFKSTAIVLTRTSKDLKGVAPAPASEWQGVAADRFNAMVIQTMAASATIADILLQTGDLFNQSAEKVDEMTARLKVLTTALAHYNKMAAIASGTSLKMVRANIASEERQIAKLHAEFMKLDTELKARFHTAVAALQEAEKMLPFRPVRIPPTGVAPKKTPPKKGKPDSSSPGRGIVPPSNDDQGSATKPSSHTIVPGDSWWGVAERELRHRNLPVTATAVQAYMYEVQGANKSAVGKVLLPGTVLVLPVPDGAGQSGIAQPAPNVGTTPPKGSTPKSTDSPRFVPTPSTPSDSTFTFDSLLLFRKK